MTIEAWKTLSSRPVYENPWIRVREDVALLPNGRTTLYGVVSLGDAVGVLPFVDENHVLLVRQYRYVFKEANRWEIPTGAPHPGEEMEAAALRELREETGYAAGRLEWLSSCYSSKSVCEQTCFLYAGTHLTIAPLPQDETEEIEVGVFTFDAALEMVRQSEIRDVMSVIAILQARKCGGGD